MKNYKGYRKQIASAPTTPQVSPVQSPKHQRTIPVMMKEKEKEKEREKEAPQPTLQTIMDTLTAMQQEAKKQNEDLKDELKVEMGDLKAKLQEMGDQMNEIKQTTKENVQKIKSVEEKMEKINISQKVFEDYSIRAHKRHDDEIITMEMQRAAHGLRFQNIPEEKDENLYEKMSELIGGILQEDPQEILKDIDELYRVQTSYARNHKLPREVHIIFTRRIVRENILRMTRNEKIPFQGNQITILKQVPRRVRESRREYYFLTKVLIKENITFRWLIPDGLSLMWEGKRIRLENPEDARNFFETTRLCKVDILSMGQASSQGVAIYERSTQSEEQGATARAEEIASGARKKQPQVQEELIVSTRLREREPTKYSK